MKHRTIVLVFIAVIIFLIACPANDSVYADIPITPGDVKFAERWASSENLEITLTGWMRPE